jgi:TolB protein
VPLSWALAASLALGADLVYDRSVAGSQGLYLMPAQGGPERGLSDRRSEDMLPRWTRDGRVILFASKRSGNWQLWEVAANGGAPRRLRRNRATEWQADESPDGTQLAFLSNIDGTERLWVMDRATGASRILVRHGKSLRGTAAVLGNPHWSPDGRTLVFSSNADFGHQIYRIDVASGKAERISPIASGGCEPRFSPDGRKLVYVSRRLWKVKSRLVEHDLSTGEEKTLVDWDALNYDPVYSPDGAELAFVSNLAGEYALYRMRLSDGRWWRVTFGAGAVRNPDYRPRS